MRKKFVVAALLLIAASPAAGEDWQAHARRDIEAAASILKENHPGFAGADKARQTARLALAIKRGTAAAADARDLAGYSHALGRFSETFEDGHLAAVAYGDINRPPFHWPGFGAVWRGDRMIVAFSDEPRIPVGAQIEACDGTPAKALIRNRLAGTGFRAREDGQYWAWTPAVFTRGSNELPRADRQCAFRIGGQRKTERLRWRPLSNAEFARQIDHPSYGERSPIGLSEPRPGLFWFGMPTFSPGDEEVALFRAMFEAMRQRRPELLRARAIVIDLRGNGGGSSLWSREAAGILWGKGAVDQRMAVWFRKTDVEWRVSAGNLAYLREIMPYLEQRGQVEAVGEVRTLIARMEAAARDGRDLVPMPAEDGKSAPFPIVRTDFRTPVYVITDGGCASACLDALDVFTRFANTRLVGAPTSADTRYLEVRNVELPSGKGRLMFAMKGWNNRPRPSGAVYQPDLPMLFIDWSTAAFIERIERDVRQPRLYQRKRAPWWRPQDR